VELKPGYKRTEVGVIPEAWEAKRLGEVAVVTAGGTPSRSNPRYWDGDIPWITTSELDFYTIDQARQFITAEGLKNSAAKLLPPGTLLMALYGQGKTRGKVGVLGIGASTNQACAASYLNRNVSSEFIFQSLARQYEAIRNLSNTGNQENLNGAIVRSISILLPPEPEQRAIAAALGDVDALLGALAQLIAKKRDLKQAAMQQLLTGQTRLPGFSGEWEFVSIGEAGHVLGGRQRSPHSYGRPTKYLRVANVFDDHIDTSDVLEMPFSSDERKRFQLEDGDILLNEGQSIDLVGRSAVYRGDPPDCCFQNTLIRFRARASTDAQFAQHSFRMFLQTGVFASIALQTTSIAHLGAGRFAALKMALPPRPEQHAIAGVLSDMDAEIVALEARRHKTLALKQGMMQELLTGRTRLV
jgi:type I restriction enzyme S subunit